MASVIPLPVADKRQLPGGFAPMPVWVPPGPTLVELLGATAVSTGTAMARPLITTAAGAAFRSRRRRPGSAATPDDGSYGDPGWFGPSSVAWKVQADPSMFVAGIAAFALQLLHPLALAGVVDHSSFADDFFGRVLRTGEFVQGVVYGGSAEAQRRCDRVRNVHTMIVGTAPDGRPYDANDPGLLDWVHLGEYHAVAAAYRRFGARPLRPAELDGYVAEVAVVGRAIGVLDPPASWSELDASLQRHRPELAVGEQTISALEFLARPPGLPAASRPAWRVAWAGAIACLPPWARRLLHLADPSIAELLACRSLIRSLGVLLGPPPPLVAARARLGLSERHGPAR